MKTVVFVIAEKNFRDEEYLVPKGILEEAGVKVITASTSTTGAMGKLGLKVVPDIHIKNINITTIDALVLIGGGGAEQYFHDASVHDLASRALKKGCIVAAICIAPIILSNAGLLLNKKATVFPSGAEQLKKGGAIYNDQDVEVDGRILTGNGPESADRFGKTLLKMLEMPGYETCQT